MQNKEKLFRDHQNLLNKAFFELNKGNEDKFKEYLDFSIGLLQNFRDSFDKFDKGEEFEEVEILPNNIEEQKD